MVERLVAVSSPLWERDFTTNLVIEELVIFEDPATDPLRAVDALIFMSAMEDSEIGGIASGLVGFPMFQIDLTEDICPNGEIPGSRA